MDVPTDDAPPERRPRGRRPNPERKAATRQKLIDAALSALTESGYAATTTTVVVERSGLSRGALFAHFPTRDALMAAVAERAMADLATLYEEAFATATAASGEPGVVVAIRCIHEMLQTPTIRAVQMLYNEAGTSPSLLEALRPVAEANYESLMERAQEVLPDLQENEFSRQAFLVMWFSLLGLASQRLVYVSPDAESTVLDGLTGFAQFMLAPAIESHLTAASAATPNEDPPA